MLPEIFEAFHVNTDCIVIFRLVLKKKTQRPE